MKLVNTIFRSDTIDKKSFLSTLVIVLCLASLILFDKEATKSSIGSMVMGIKDIFGSFYLILTIFCFIFLLYVALSKKGNYRFGGPEQKPEFSYFSWIGMLFCSGIGGALVYWSGVEWGYYVNNPQFGIKPLSPESYSLATAYGLFHWGISAWAIYGLPALALSVDFYKYKLSTLRLSSGLRGLGIKDVENTFFGRSVDLIFIIATLGAAGGTIGSYLPMLGLGFSDIFSIENSFFLTILVLIVCITLFGFSVYSGLKNGIKVLSNINLTVAILFLLYVLLTGPTSEILSYSLSGVWYSIKYFFDMSTLGIVESSQFAQDWTIWYWAWWVAFGPIVGLFIARISKGRTVRELILGMLVFGTLGTWLFYLILGNYSLVMDINGTLQISNINALNHPEMALSVVNSLPLPKLMLLIFCIMTLIFITTSYDSMSYVVAYHIQRNSSELNDPDRLVRVFWAIILGVLPASLVIYSDHTVATDIILLTSLPLLFIYPLIALATIRDMFERKVHEKTERS